MKFSRNFIAKYLILITILTTAIVSAEEVTLVSNEIYTFKNINLELISVGTQGSISINVNNIRTTLSQGKEKIVLQLNLTLIDTSADTAKISIIQNTECIVNEDCSDDNSCTENICSDLKECIFKKSEGCITNGGCVPPGTLSEQNGVLSYCSQGFEWEKRKLFNEPCSSNYECLSNLCMENLCTKHKTDGPISKMAPAWILIVIGVILLIKGALLLYHPEKTKNMLRELSYMKHFNMRIFGALMAVIGILLMAWALA